MNERRSTQQIRLGMVVWHGLPAAVPRAGKSIGGLETGAWTLAKGLAMHTSIQPKFIVRTSRLFVPSEIDQVELVARHEFLESTRNRVAECVDVGPPLKLLKWRVALSWQLPLLAVARPFKGPRVLPMQPDPRLPGIDVDVWAGFGVSADTARVAATASAQHRPMVLFLESNADLDPRLATNEDFVNAYGETSQEQRYALQHATAIICQSNYQKDLLTKHFGRTGVLLRNPINRQEWVTKTRPQRRYVLWIGRYDTFHKRPELALEIARRCPHLQFRMIINPQDSDVEQRVRSTKPENVEILGYVPFDQMSQQFAGASVFLCTGSPEHEGFPNVLLQSAASQTPICSLTDFDDFLATSKAGVGCDEDLEIVVKELNAMAEEDKTDWTYVSAYLDQNHSRKAISIGVEQLLLDLLRHRGGSIDA